jgi:hypothetical protein
MTFSDRRYSAQDRYAQHVLDYLWDNAEDICVAGPEGVFYKGSLHMLVRQVRPSAQAGDVVNIMRSSGAVIQAGHGLWQLIRRAVFATENGEPVNFNQPLYGHEPLARIQDRNFAELNKRLSDVEGQLSQLQSLVLGIVRGDVPIGDVDVARTNGQDSNSNEPQEEIQLVGEQHEEIAPW